MCWPFSCHTRDLREAFFRGLWGFRSWQPFDVVNLEDSWLIFSREFDGKIYSLTPSYLLKNVITTQEQTGLALIF